MKYGVRLIYDKNTGRILNNVLNMEGDIAEWTRPEEIDFVDLLYEYNDNNFKQAIEYHIDVSKDKETTDLKDLIVITKYKEPIETEEEKLKREKQELENQLLLQADNNLDGGIL